MYISTVTLATLVIIPVLLKIFAPYFWEDVFYLKELVRILLTFVSRRKRRPLFLAVDRFIEQSALHPNRTFILFENKSYSYQDADKESNKIANALRSHACSQSGETVALFMRNEPTFMFTWLALAKLGCPVAFLNHNIRSKSLLHCFSCCDAKVLIAAVDLEDALTEIKTALEEKGITFKSPAVYIYTSGTTGLPKAAMVSQTRLLAALAVLASNGVTAGDVIYLNLPLYHTAGFLIGFIGTIETGSSIVLRRKFSASQFWDECRKYNVTVIQYIGEVIRYLCNTPKKQNDKDHKVRLAIGNGLRTDVWRKFLNRFGNIQIREFYASTEGNVGFVNYIGKIGAIGRVNLFHKTLFPYALIKYDTERDEPMRNAKGLCIKAPKGETGLLVSKITDIAPFVGYANNQQQTEKKRLRNVFKNGDLYFNSGDLLRIDSENFIYFQDRVGDTFRWKGENVATTEVSDIVTMIDFVEEANVYGVQVPGHEGRIGMAAITITKGKELDCKNMFSHVASYLPAYAQPRFIRIQNCVEVTGTFKQMKKTLVEEGFNPTLVTDPLFFLDDKDKSYVPMTEDIFQAIVCGNIKL
ncbi:very long-chain acyl-CoA synthetase isoform X2 [Alosa sapidissima]|uniref:very long-chain acyl-CoA synthetase isoform X2 n=1 Tax=Alosa sapidissima TaxID=34773 RepID=UPI001C09AA73|nr:very long-chain acyl-CoA synthetase isoform X2 [Alosa sapidissima]